MNCCDHQATATRHTASIATGLITPWVPLVALLVCLGGAGTAAENTLSAELQKNPDLQLKTALESRSRGLSWAAFALYVNGAPTPSIPGIARFASMPGNEEKAAQLIAIAKQGDAILTSLLAHRQTERLAAAVLACRATMDAIDADKAWFMAEATAAVAARRSIPRPRKKEDTIDVPAALIRLLGARDSGVRDLALIAIVLGKHGGPDIDAAIDAIKDANGVVPGARLLHHVNRGDKPDAQAVAAAFAVTRGGVPVIKDPESRLALPSLLVPSVSLACQALGQLGDAAHLDHLHRALADNDVRIQVDAARAIARIADPSSVPVLLARLERCPWPVLVGICDALGRIPDPASVPPLIALLRKQTGRFRMDIVHALSSIAGNQFGRQTADDWQKWWTEQNDAFVVDPAATAAYRSTYRVQDVSMAANLEFYGLAIPSDRFCLVLDSSGSMAGDRLTNLRDNARQSMGAMGRTVTFNIVDFGGDINWFNAKGLTSDRRAGVAFIENLMLSGATRTWDGIEEGALLDDIDTLVFLSDGAPNGSQVPTWPLIYRTTCHMNRYRPLAIWGVSFRAGAASAKAIDLWCNEHAGRSTNID